MKDGPNPPLLANPTILQEHLQPTPTPFPIL